MALGELDQRGPGGLLDVRGVDDGEQATTKAGPDDVVQDVERVGRGGLVVLVVGHQPAAEVTGDNLGGLEVGAGERRLPAP